MQVKETTTYTLFELDELRQELVIDSLNFFINKVKKLNPSLSAIYPADPIALPFSMYLSDKLSIPIKTEKFLNRSDRILMVFSYMPFKYLTDTYLDEKIRIFRKSFPYSPSLLIASSEKAENVDFQLIKVKKLQRINSYRFLTEGFKNFYFPLEGEFIHFTQTLWDLSKKEIKTFEKAKRIRDSAQKYLREEVIKLEPVENYIEIAIWEKFQKNLLVIPQKREKEEESFSLKIEKLIQVSDSILNSAVTSLLEYLAQSFEYIFPTHLAYSNLEIIERRGITIIPKVTQVMDGVDVKLEIILKSENIETDFKKLIAALKDTLKIFFEEIFKKEAFRPSMDSIVEKETSKAIVYLNWFLDREMIETLYKKINRKWLLTRLYYRKQLKSKLREFFKLLKEFRFSPENLETLFSSLESLWKKNYLIVKLYSKEIKNLFEKKNLWPLIGVYGLKLENANSSQLKELLHFLLSLKNYENLHQFLAKENRYFVPVKTKRIYRPNWERVIREKQDIYLKAEPLNPQSPVTYTLHSEDGKFLGVIPEIIAHYITAKETTGKTIKCRELYFDPDIFSDTSYWVEIECL
ncbi:hypothetical protein Dester_0779 [Desulfurobacterium thermolithotrophum DSM 11699]|uniref:HIRAN domain-containing protein n=1 Tax=Desulfurobacterium thermolithotrophum (strain DSM 11699 / BSA) TaxID=868864 RepID=F0S3J8_DESTD|nr:hypothetical protein [Desulfurobacterium thermolithotrophum]ADY73420.1 hypothetical protein Dester_0779 [Desulfurobacterium thermolithotrophum DSM 11699]